VLLALLPSCSGSQEKTLAEVKSPNIVLLVVDTLRGDMVSQEDGSTNTPGFDSIAEDGVNFPSAFSHAPMTLPAHTSLFSSRAPFETGVLNNWQDVREDLPLLAEWLRERGYQTRAVVSLGTLDRRGQEALGRGFDSFDQDYWHMDQAPRALTRIRASLDKMEAERPFFLFAHFSDPHEPYNLHAESDKEAEVYLDGELVATLSISDMSQWVGEFELELGKHELEIKSEAKFRINALEWTQEKKFVGATWEQGKVRTPSKRVLISGMAKTKAPTEIRVWITESVASAAERRNRYISEVNWMDTSIGEFVVELKTRGIYDDTLILFTSDHGESLGEHGAFGHVQNLYDEMIHVPLVIKPLAGDPRIEVLRSVRKTVVPHQDLVPTILELAGLPDLPGSRGTSLLSMKREALAIAETHKPEANRNLICFRDSEFKLIYDSDKDAFELYDLEQDPGEENNVYGTRRNEREEWVAAIKRIADLAQSGAMSEGEVSPETRELLDALGYGGSDE
jgi:arylsulfatase